MSVEWTEEDKAAHMLFVQQIRDLRADLNRAEFHRVEMATRDIRQRLDAALVRLASR